MSAVFVAAAAFYAPESFGIGTRGDIHGGSLVEMSLGLAIGAVTFSGSVIAFAKLQALMWTAPGRKACLAFSRERHWRVEGSAVRSRSPAVNAAHILRSLAPCLSEILLHTITLLITGLRDRPLPQRWSGWKAHGMCTSRLSRDGLALCRPPHLVAVQDSIRPA